MATLKTITKKSNPEDRKSYRWEDSEPEKAHEVAVAWADMVRELPVSVDRRKRSLLYASMYANVPLLGFGVNQYTRTAQNQSTISLNVTQNAIDSLVAKICKNKPRPMFTTVEGDYELREMAENADKYVDGKFTNDGYYDEVHPGCVLDSAIYGLGVAKSHVVDEEACCDRTFPHELIVDERTALYGRPPRIGHRKYYDKQELFDLWRRDKDKSWTKKLEQAIEAGGAENDPDFGEVDRDESSDQILAYEFYVPATKRRVGSRVTCIRGLTLDFSEYKDIESPFTFLRPMVNWAGLYGIGCAEKIIGIQREINRIVRDIQMAMHLIAKPHWMVEASSNVMSQHLNNDIATIIKYSGAVPPHVYTPTAMAPDVYAHLQFLYRTAYEILGVSQMSAQSQKPAGIDSAVGLRTLSHVETERFSGYVQASEGFASQNARRMAKNLSRAKTKQVLAPNGKTSNFKVTWKPLDLDSYKVQVYPTSKLPDTPAGRREFALELAQYGIAKTDDLYEILELGDTEAFAKRRLAGRKNVERDVMRIRRGEKVIRDAIGDHQVALAIMTDAYEEMKHDGLPEARLAVARQYVKACVGFLNKAKPPPAPAAPTMMGPPPGQPPLPGVPGEPPPALPNAPMGPIAA